MASGDRSKPLEGLASLKLRLLRKLLLALLSRERLRRWLHRLELVARAAALLSSNGTSARNFFASACK